MARADGGRPTEADRTPEHQRLPMDRLITYTGTESKYQLARLLNEPNSHSGAVARAWDRGWCTLDQADRWAVHGLGILPHGIWPEWLDAALHPLDRLYPLEEWWRYAWDRSEAALVSLAESRNEPSDVELAAIEAEAA